MKQLFALLFLFAMVGSSCTKEYTNNPTDGSGQTDDNDDNNSGGGGGTGGGGGGFPTIDPVPSTFSQKVLVEEYTGEWCGYCPDGALKIEELEGLHPDVVYGAAVHDNDPYALVPFSTNLESTFNVTGFPSGTVNRIPQGVDVAIDRNMWSGTAGSLLVNTAVCGLAMTSYKTTTDSMYVEVHCGFNSTLSGDYRLTVYLVENGIVSDGQANYYDDGSIDPNSPLVGIGDPIDDWVHNDVIRKVLTADLGDAIPSSKMIPGGEHVVKLGTPIGTFNDDNLSIIAFINKVGGAPTEHEILNVQKAKLQEVKNWD